jgi:hypothetical protein
MDLISKRSLLVTRLTIYPSVVTFTASILLLLFSQNKWLGVAFGIMSLWAMIGSFGVYLSGILCASTQRILKAIEIVAEQKSQDGRIAS